MSAANKRLTFVDAMVLIYAARGKKGDDRKKAALAVLGDPSREFVASEYLRLEVMPMAVHYHKHNEQRFYERYFHEVVRWVDPATLIAPAYDLACRHGLGAVDALHIAAATLTDAEFVTAERKTKPIYAAYPKILSIF